MGHVEKIPLDQIKVKDEEMERANELGSILGREYKTHTIDGSSHSEGRVIRDTAITLLRQSRLEIRRWVRLVYFDNKEVRDQFSSKSIRAKRKKNQVEHVDEVIEQPVEQITEQPMSIEKSQEVGVVSKKEDSEAA